MLVCILLNGAGIALLSLSVPYCYGARLSHVEVEVIRTAHEVEYDGYTEVGGLPEERCSPGHECHEGDMVLPPMMASGLLVAQNTSGLLEIGVEDMLWPNGIVYYRFEDGGNRSLRHVPLQAMRLWEGKTCVKFEERSHDDHVHTLTITFEENSGCFATTGYLGHQSREMNLGKGCLHIGTALHELGHVLGLSHEHSRHGRDKYIKINTLNIKPNMSKWFKEHPWRYTRDTAKVPYDLSSIMHYDAWAFALKKNLSDASTQTISVTNKDMYGNCDIGQRSRLSIGDVLTVATMYNCRNADFITRACVDTNQFQIKNLEHRCEYTELKGKTCGYLATRGWTTGWRKGKPYCSDSRVQDACPVACGACADVAFCRDGGLRSRRTLKDFNEILYEAGLKRYASRRRRGGRGGQVANRRRRRATDEHTTGGDMVDDEATLGGSSGEQSLDEECQHRANRLTGNDQNWGTRSTAQHSWRTLHFVVLWLVLLPVVSLF